MLRSSLSEGHFACALFLPPFCRRASLLTAPLLEAGFLDFTSTFHFQPPTPGCSRIPGRNLQKQLHSAGSRFVCVCPTQGHCSWAWFHSCNDKGLGQVPGSWKLRLKCLGPGQPHSCLPEKGAHPGLWGSGPFGEGILLFLPCWQASRFMIKKKFCYLLSSVFLRRPNIVFTKGKS